MNIVNCFNFTTIEYEKYIPTYNIFSWNLNYGLNKNFKSFQ